MSSLSTMKMEKYCLCNFIFPKYISALKYFYFTQGNEMTNFKLNKTIDNTSNALQK